MIERNAAGLIKDPQSFGAMLHDPMLKNELINNTKVNDAIQTKIRKEIYQQLI